MFNLQEYEEDCENSVDLQCLFSEIQGLTAKTNKIMSSIRKNLLAKEAKVLLAKEDKHLVQL